MENSKKYYKLDNPVWYSLLEIHQEMCVDYGEIKFYNPEYCSFGGFQNKDNYSEKIDLYSKITNNFYLVGEKPKISNKLKINKELVCLQMVCDSKIDLEITENIIALNNNHSNELFNLINLVQPGYFKEKTHLLGNYFGIFKNKKLVAVTGERMKMNDFTEISAVVTHPDYLGNGFAKQLVAFTVNYNLKLGKIAYLHVLENNIGAINLYEKLGFKTRRKISFWNIILD